MTKKEPICLKCKWLVWDGFLAHCVHVVFPDDFFDDVQKLVEAKERGASEKELAVIEQQIEIKDEKSLEALLRSTYIVWRRKSVVKYYEHAPKTPKECPFGFTPKSSRFLDEDNTF